MASSRLSFLGLLFKGGSALIGEAISEKASYGLLLLAKDAGRDTAKKARLLAHRGNIPLDESYTKLELGSALGKAEVSLVAIKNKKAARSYLEKGV